MSEVATFLKSLKKIKPQTVGELEYQIDKNLVRTHPGLMDSSALWYGGKMTTYLNEVTKNDTSQYAIAMMDPDELSKTIGRANMDDPGVRDRVLDLYNRAASGSEGLRSVVKLDGLVNEKGFIDVTRITPGSQETAEALRLLDRDRPVGAAPHRIPVLVHASGANWAADPAPRLRYNGQTSGTLSMPKWDARRPAPITKTVADGTSPSFYKDQPRNRDQALAKLNVFYDPQASMVHGDATSKIDSFDPIAAFPTRVQNPTVRYTAESVKRAAEFRDARRRQVEALLNPLVDQYGPEELKRLAGKNNIFTMKLLGAKGPDADLPMVFVRTERFGTEPLQKGSFSPALTASRETGMHAGEPNSARAFQGNPSFHDYNVALREMKDAPAGSERFRTAQRAIDIFESKKASLRSMLATMVPDLDKRGSDLYDAVKEAEDQYVKTLKPGERTDITVANSRGRELLQAALKKRMPDANPEKLERVARSLSDYVGLTRDKGTTTKPFIPKDIQRPLFLIDTGDFRPNIVLQQLVKMPEFEKPARQMLLKEHLLDNVALSKQITDMLDARGYDSIVYLNSTAEGSTLNKYADMDLEDPRAPTGYTPSIAIWREDKMVPIESLPNRGNPQLKKALALLVAGEATKDNKDGSSN